MIALGTVMSTHSAAGWAGRGASIFVAVLEEYTSGSAIRLEYMKVTYTVRRVAILALLEGGGGDEGRKQGNDEDGETHCEERFSGLW